MRWTPLSHPGGLTKSTAAQLVLVAPKPRWRSAVPEQAVNVNVAPRERMPLTVVEAARRLGIGCISLDRLLNAEQIRSIVAR